MKERRARRNETFSGVSTLWHRLTGRPAPLPAPPAPPPREEARRQRFEAELAKRLATATDVIRSQANVDSALIRAREELRAAFASRKCIIYRRDGERLLNPYAGGSSEHAELEYNEVALAIDSDLAGFVAVTRRSLQLHDCYDTAELARVAPQLRFDSSWDQRHGVRTAAALAAPMMDPAGHLLGVIQFQRTADEGPFAPWEAEALGRCSHALAEALYRKVGRIPEHFAHLVPAYLDEEALRALLLEHASERERIELLMERHGVPKEAIGEALARRCGCDFIAYEPERELPEVAGLNEAYLRKNLWVPVALDPDGTLVVAIDNPRDANRTSEVALFLEGRPIEFRVALAADIERYIERREQANRPEEAPTAGIADALERLEIVTEEDERAAEEGAGGGDELQSDSPAIRLVDNLILEGVHKGASDIHIEPIEVEEQGRRKRHLRVRYRIDGECTNAITLPIQVTRAVIARIKIMSRLDGAERRLPQSGKIKVKGRNVELRVETCPTSLGEEKAVLRILASKLISLDKLIPDPVQFRRFDRIIGRPHGIVLVVGPTGSGKTTTLHAALHHRNDPSVNIITAEDPVEITQPGITQVQVNYDVGLTFPQVLRSFLRQDPDIIMVGEIRDTETARIALEAAQTGHLVFSTLHTNSAPETVTRLFDLGLDPYYFASAISGILAQRLLRRLCDCKRPHELGAEELAEWGRGFGDEELRQVLEGRERVVVHEAVGCERCEGSGYRGRLGIHEIMDKTPQLVELIQRKAATPELKAQAIKDGMYTLFQDGMRKVLAGETTREEVVRVCSSDE